MYEIKNNINGKIYVGVHKTKVEDDGYMGSGKVIKRAIEKHGIENFTKTILERFDTLVEMFEREKEVVNEEFLARDDTYNLRRGGYGGFDHVNKTGVNNRGKTLEQQRQLMTAMNNKVLSDPVLFEEKRLRSRKVFLDMHAKGTVNYKTFSGKTHSEDSKQKISVAMQSKTGILNSQFGSMWITNGTENKKITKDESIPDGWTKGRKLSPL